MNIEESINNLDYSDTFINMDINNKKATDIPSRFLEIISDPNNHFLIKHKKAGKEENNYIYTLPGIKVYKNSYYGNFINILKINNGSHEPSEERLFQNILTDIDAGGVMLELGSYWCYYSMWFNKTIKNAKNFCVEPGKMELNIGKRNCALNKVVCDFTKGYVGCNIGVPREANDAKIINLNDYLKEKGIEQLDLLHSDIQGGEFEMLKSITNLLNKRKIKYLFISTHSDKLHYDCIELLKSHNYRIIASSDFESETFCYDGIIVACQKDNNKFQKISLGNRKYTKLITKI